MNMMKRLMEVPRRSSIKQRLRLSYLGMLVIPFALTLLVSILAGKFYTGNVMKSLGVDSRLNPLRNALDVRSEIFAQIKLISLEDPEQLLDQEYLSKLEETIGIFSTGVMIRKEHQLVYASPMLVRYATEVRLPEFGAYFDDLVFPRMGEDTGELLVSQHDFYFSDRERGTVFWAMDMKPLVRVFQRVAGLLTLAVTAMIMLTNIGLTYLVAGSIIRPLNRLKDSADQIKEGNLDFKLVNCSNDEIGELTQAFEEMRARLKESLDKQMQYEENRKELISNISHDLKTPITSIKGYIEGVWDGVADTPEKMNKYLRTIHMKAVDVDRLIDELFLFSKLDLNRLPLDLSRVQLNLYLADIVEEQSFDLEKSQIELLFYPSEEPVGVLADGKQLKRVIVNIIQNSVKYMDKAAGRVVVRVEAAEEEVTVLIEDNGRGIPAQALPFIFDRFYRADASRNSQTGGSGLGLSIAKMIIEEHGGKMGAESVEGQGTTIYFTLKKYKW